MRQTIKIFLPPPEKPRIIELTKLPSGKQSAFWDYCPHQDLILLPQRIRDECREEFLREALDYRKNYLKAQLNAAKKALRREGIDLIYSEFR